MNQQPIYATAKAYRVKGGAIVTITRPDGRTRRHRVSNARFLWLRELFGYACAGGSFTSSGFSCRIGKPLCPEWQYMRQRDSS